MKQAINTNLFASKSPLEWAITANNQLYTTQIPITQSGDIIEGDIRTQATQMFDNLVHTLECANATTDNVTQVLIYVTKREDLSGFNDVYAQYFQAPYPNRAAIIVSGFARPEMLCEIVVYATL
jgi:enamine deaminase RidA (YjgF/YER057c/UK114 family)